MSKTDKKKSPVSAICSALGTTLLVIIILICIPLTLPKFLGYEAFTVISGSMEPEIPVGSLVFIGTCEPQEAAVGDVIAFYGGSDSNAIITHRVVENRVVMGEIITKGDANEQNDINPVKYDQFIGRAELSVPQVGAMAQFFTGTTGKIAAGCAIGSALILHLMAAILDKKE